MLGNAQTKHLKGYGDKVTKADKRDYLNLMLDWNQFDDSMKTVLAPILYSLIVETGKDALKQLHLDPSMFNPIATEVISYYQARAEKIAVDVNDETEKQLRATIGQGIDAGEDDAQLQARIEAVFGAALTYRADRIARTETTRAMGFGDVEAWKQSGMVTGHEWYCVHDERTCPFCLDLDGTIVSLDSDFYQLGDVMEVEGKTLHLNYDDIPTEPLHVNCRCLTLPVTIPLDEAIAA